jgi:hypothetical protein
MLDGGEMGNRVRDGGLGRRRRNRWSRKTLMKREYRCLGSEKTGSDTTLG